LDFGQIEGYKDHQLDDVKGSDSSDSDSSSQSGSRSTDSEELGNMHEYIEESQTELDQISIGNSSGGVKRDQTMSPLPDFSKADLN
jgi:hypothetical protein